MRFFAPAALVALVAALPLRAQTMTGTLPDSVVVTASREAERARDTGRRVTVLTAADIARLPVASFDELLRAAAGVEVFSRGPFGVQSDLTVRGSTFGGVLVLVDGVRFNDPMTGHFLSDFPIPLAEVARIEVLRGPASALYGPDAVGGVVQVFTFTGMGAGRGGQLSLEGGQHALALARAAGRVQRGAFTMGAAGAYDRSDGHAIRNLDGTESRRRADFARGAATVALRHAARAGALFARAAFDARAFDAERFYTNFPSDTAREATETYWAQAGFEQHPGARTRLSVQVGGRLHDDRYTYNPRTPANTHTSRQATVLAAVHHTVGAGLVATGGVTGALRGIQSNNMGRHRDASGGAYAGLRATLGGGFSAGGSTRLDYDPGYGAEVTPGVAAAFTRGAVTLRAGGGRSVRAPSYIERFSDTQRARPSNLGNPDLKAERAWTAEGGASLYLAGAQLHATLFHRDVQNLIDFVKLAPTDTYFRARNLLRVQTTGVELEARATPGVGAARLHLDAAYTFLDASLRGVPSGAQAKYALTSARHLAQASAAFDAGGATVGVQALVKKPIAGDAYTVVGARGGYLLPLRALRVQITAEVRNVFDTRYTEIFAPMPGRWLVFGVRAAF